MTTEEAREYFAGDRFATKVTGIEILEKTDGRAVCSLKLTDEHRNALGAVMGGAIYTLCDFAFAVATNDKEKHTVTAVSQISYLSAAKGNTLTATAEPVKDGKRSCFYEIKVTDDLGVMVAIAMTNGMHL